MAIGLAGSLDMVTDSFMMSVLVPITILGIGGGLPFLLERRRLDRLNSSLPELLEGISTSLGAGLGLQQSINSMALQRDDQLGHLLRRAVARSKVTTFNAAMSEFALDTRSPTIQRAMNLLQTADENEAPLQDVTFSMAMEYDRLLRLKKKREMDLKGKAYQLIGMMCFLLPAIIGLMFGLFAGPTSGIPMLEFHPVMMLFLAATSVFSIFASAIMLGRSLTSAVWWIPLWALISQVLYMGSYLLSSLFV